VSHADSSNYQPTNITQGIMQPLENPPKDKLRRKIMIAERALADLAEYIARTARSSTPSSGASLRPGSVVPA
jgi:folate-dependent tRNA-U54 methylase TrmFO/GidA